MFFTHTQFQVSCRAWFSLSVRSKNKPSLKYPCPFEHGSETPADWIPSSCRVNAWTMQLSPCHHLNFPITLLTPCIHTCMRVHTHVWQRALQEECKLQMHSLKTTCRDIKTEKILEGDNSLAIRVVVSVIWREECWYPLPLLIYAKKEHEASACFQMLSWLLTICRGKCC